MASEVVVFLPGIMGSVLKDGPDVVWPGSVSELLLPYGKMAQLLKEDLAPSDIIRRVSVSKQYDAAIAALATCGFKEDTQPPTLYVCPYDWRKDNAIAADRLADVVDKAVAAHGQTVDVVLIGHSMGGLVSRYYLESGRYSERAGFGNVRRLITLGTPHRGAPLALQAALGQIKRLFLNEAQVKTIANDARYPALYQLLPPVGEPFAWDETAAKRFDPIDIYDPAISQQLGLSSQNLAAAKQFHGRLDLTKRPSKVKYFFFSGTRQTTVSEVRVRLTQMPVRVRAEERDDAGDGTVPIWSASQSGIQMAPVGGEHGDIYKDGRLQQVLAVLLGKAGVLAAALPTIEIAIREPVLTPGTQTTAAIVLGQPAAALSLSLKMVRIVDNAGNVLPAPTAVSTKAISYSGAPIDRLNVVVEAPQLPGIYQLQLLNAGLSAVAAHDDLFVQAP